MITKARTRNESGLHKGGLDRPKFQKQKGNEASSVNAPVLRNRSEYNSQNLQNFKAKQTQSKGSLAQRGSWDPSCGRCCNISYSR